MRTLKEVRRMIRPEREKKTRRWLDYKGFEDYLTSMATMKVGSVMNVDEDEFTAVAVGSKLGTDASFRKRLKNVIEARLKSGYAIPTNFDMTDLFKMLKPKGMGVQKGVLWVLYKKPDEFLRRLETITQQTIRPRRWEKGEESKPFDSRKGDLILDYHREVEDYLTTYMKRGKAMGLFDDEPFILEIGTSTGESLEKAKKKIRKMFPKARFLHTDVEKNPLFIHSRKEFLKHNILEEQFRLDRVPDVIVFTNVMLYFKNKKKAWENMLTATGKDKPTLVLAGSSAVFSGHRHLVAGNKVIPLRAKGPKKHLMYIFTKGGKKHIGKKTQTYFAVEAQDAALLAKGAKEGVSFPMKRGQYSFMPKTLKKFLKKARAIL